MFAWYLHEIVFSYILFPVRWYQGYGAEVVQSWTAFFTGYFTTAIIVAIGFYLFRNRMRFSYWFVPFIAVNLFWVAIGYPTSLAWPASFPFDGSLLTNAVEEAYTITFMLGLWKSMK